MRTNTPKPITFDHPTIAARWLTETVALADRAGIVLPGTAEALELLDAAARFRNELTDRRKAKLSPSALARRLVDGDLSLEDVARIVVTDAAYTEQRGALASTVAAAEQLATALALRTMRAAVGPDVLDACRDAVADVLDGIRKLRPTLDGIASAEQAAKAGAKTAAAWSTYGTLTERLDDIYAVAARLRAVHWIDPVPDGTRPDEIRYARPDFHRDDTRRTDDRGRRVPHRGLLDPVSEQWAPGGPFTADEIEAHRAKHTPVSELVPA